MSGYDGKGDEAVAAATGSMGDSAGCACGVDEVSPESLGMPSEEDRAASLGMTLQEYRAALADQALHDSRDGRCPPPKRGAYAAYDDSCQSAPNGTGVTEKEDSAMIEALAASMGMSIPDYRLSVGLPAVPCTFQRASYHAAAASALPVPGPSATREASLDQTVFDHRAGNVPRMANLPAQPLELFFGGSFPFDGSLLLGARQGSDLSVEERVRRVPSASPSGRGGQPPVDSSRPFFNLAALRVLRVLAAPEPETATTPAAAVIIPVTEAGPDRPPKTDDHLDGPDIA